MSQKKDQRLVQSEEAIVEAGIKTLLNNPSAGMSDIANAAGVGRATLYRHFPSREELIRRIALLCLSETERAFKPFEHLRGREAIEKIFDVLMPFAARFRFLGKLWSLVEEDAEILAIEARMDREMGFLFDEAKKTGVLNASLPTAWIKVLFDNVLDAGWVMIEDGDATPQEAAHLAKISFFDGCAAR